MRVPPGVSLLLIGSGLYWVLSSHLIWSFTVLTPGLFQSLPSGQILITTVGILCLVAGLWTVNRDLNEFRNLANSPAGHIYVLPVAFVSLDLCSTLASLSLNSSTIELNPFVSSAIQYGFAAIAPFLISYLALSQGLAILMLRIGSWLFGESGWMRVLPFALICAVSSFGPFSNMLGLVLGYEGLLVYVFAALTSGVLAIEVCKVLRTVIALRPLVLS